MNDPVEESWQRAFDERRDPLEDLAVLAELDRRPEVLDAVVRQRELLAALGAVPRQQRGRGRRTAMLVTTLALLAFCLEMERTERATGGEPVAGRVLAVSIRPIETKEGPAGFWRHSQSVRAGRQATIENFSLLRKPR